MQWHKQRPVELHRTIAESDGGWFQLCTYGPLVVEWFSDERPGPRVEGCGSCRFALRDGQTANIQFPGATTGRRDDVLRYLALFIESLRGEIGADFI